MPRRALRNSHQTTIRFTREMWVELEIAAARTGVSVAHYVREAARARLAEERKKFPPLAPEEVVREIERRNVVEHSFERVEDSAALWEQGRLARERARLLRAESQSRRKQER
jgi:predicted DNA-binding protein